MAPSTINSVKQMCYLIEALVWAVVFLVSFYFYCLLHLYTFDPHVRATVNIENKNKKYRNRVVLAFYRRINGEN